MSVTGMAALILWLGLIPLGIGTIPARLVDKKQKDIGFMWTTGYILMWALFQCICVPLILLEKEGDAYFPYVVYIFGGCAAALAAFGIVRYLAAGLWGKKKEIVADLEKNPFYSKGSKLLWAAAALLILLQLVLSVCMHYADGDDAFYVAVSTLTQGSDTMYKLMPYSMGGTGLNRRHSTAPFPIWIAFLSRVSGVHTTIVAHTVVATVLIFMTYVIYYQIGKCIFREKEQHLPGFLMMTALLVIFGDYSIYSVENFMIARSRQGKAALGNIIIPMAVLLFLEMFERIRKQQKIEWMRWVLLAAVVTAACLCSTLGTFLMCLFIGVVGLCAGAVYKSPLLVLKMACCCVPALIFGALYFLIG